jgi:hypothetical protein
MTITQTVEIPANRRLTIDVPSEVPAGRAILAFTPDSAALSDDVTERLNQYYSGRVNQSDAGVREAACRLFAKEEW